jgi:2-polyprenyl-3-methyl-5-hydroxy-6-metoxy-1,4-benzoquinol methylase
VGQSAEEENSLTKKKLDVSEDTGITTPSVHELMADIRASVEARSLESLASMPRFSPGVADCNEAGERKAGELRDSEFLRYLNFHHGRTLALNPEVVRSHRGGIVGKVVVAAKRRLLVWIAGLLSEYFEQEVAYRANLVRFLNQVSTYGDARDAAIFWELIHKIDTDVGNALRRIEAIHTEGQIELQRVEAVLRDQINADLGTLRSSSSSAEVRMQALERVVSGLERIIALASKRLADGNTDPISFVSDQSYVLLENRFRGSEAEIAQRVAPYVGDLVDAGPVLEIGCGRGELMQLLVAAGIDARGVDMDPAMVEVAREKGLSVEYGNGLGVLQQCEDASLGAVIAVQVVEHLSQADLGALIELCARKVRAGGKIIFETINPRSLLALSSNYFRDPTHVWPLHPDTLSYLMTLGGLEHLETRMLSPVPLEAQLPAVPKGEFLSPKWEQMVASLNVVIERLNGLLYGYQDYCVIAQVPTK